MSSNPEALLVGFGYDSGRFADLQTTPVADLYYLQTFTKKGDMASNDIQSVRPSDTYHGVHLEEQGTVHAEQPSTKLATPSMQRAGPVSNAGSESAAVSAASAPCPPNLATLRHSSSKELTEIFANRTGLPKAKELEGEYTVVMLTGPIPTLEAIGHHKAFRRQGDQVVGENFFWKKTGWGHFRVEDSAPAEPGEPPSLLLNYDVPANVLSRRVRDRVRCVTPGELYLGRFNIMLLGKPRFIGYFALSRRHN